MDPQTFEKFRKVIYDASGISLQNGKESLVSGRVSKRVTALGLAGPAEYINFITRDPHGHDEIVYLLDAISTNVTQFFRESEHFDFLKEHIQDWYKSGQRKFRVWSAASSTGEEPYTIAMVIRHLLPDQSLDLKVLGTDISTKVLAQAKQGLYDEERLNDLQPGYKKFFLKTKSGEKIQYQIQDEIRSFVTYCRLNLSTPPFPMKGPFDFVFCRNVMIYFDKIVREKLVREIHRLLRPGGYLLIGHSESLTGLDVPYKPVRSSIYVSS